MSASLVDEYEVCNSYTLYTNIDKFIDWIDGLSDDETSHSITLEKENAPWLVSLDAIGEYPMFTCAAFLISQTKVLAGKICYAKIFESN